jgi:hypothetical protein
MIAPHSRCLPNVHADTAARPPVPRRALAIFAGATGLVSGIAAGAMTAMLELAITGAPWHPPRILAFFATFFGVGGLLAGTITTAGVAAGGAAWHTLRWHWPHRVRVRHLPTLAGLGVAMPVFLTIMAAFALGEKPNVPLLGAHVAVAGGAMAYIWVQCAVALVAGESIFTDDEAAGSP